MTGAFNKPVVCPILIGRTDEIAVFHKLIDEAKSSKGQAILLCGEAGIGKSRLVAELKTEAATLGLQSLPGHGFPTDSSCPYTPLADALRSVFLHTPAAQFAWSHATGHLQAEATRDCLLSSLLLTCTPLLK